MLPYFLLIAIPLVFTFVAFDRKAESGAALRIGFNRAEPVQQHNLALPVFFLLLFVMLACRSDQMGTDTQAYREAFEVYGQQSLKYFDLWRAESVFRFLNWVVYSATGNFQIFLTIIAGITLLPIMVLYCEDRHRSFMKIIVFVGMSTFVMAFSGIRQMLAVSLGVLAYMCVRNRKPVVFLLVSLLALGIHHSAFMILLMYPLYHLRLKKNHLWFVVPAVIAVFVFNSQIFGALNVLLAQYDESYEAIRTTSTGAYMSLILFAVFAAFSYIVPDESKMDSEMYGLRNFLLLTVVLQSFAPLHSMSMRMNYYYIIFIPITVAKFTDIPQLTYKRVARLAAIVITLYFLWDYINTIYTGYTTGISALDTVPYIPFWK